MLRSLYAYKGTHARTLAFSVDEKFLEIGVSRDPNWVHVISENGKLGFVPKNYVALDQASPIEMLELIDACIEGIHLAASEKGGNYSRFEHEGLQVLVERRQEWHAKVPPSLHPSKRPAPPPPHRTTSQLSVDSVGSTVSDGSLPSPSQPLPSVTTPTSLPVSMPDTIPITTIPITPPEDFCTEDTRHPKRQGSEVETTTSFIGRGDSLAAEENGCTNDPPPQLPVKRDQRTPTRKGRAPEPSPLAARSSISEVEETIPKGYFRQLVEEVRSNTNISFLTSQQVVTLVLQSLGASFTQFSPVLTRILRESRESSGLNSPGCDSVGWESSGDGRRLVGLLEKLRQCKDDEQQRSWALHEDEFTIKEHLNDLLDVLTNGELEVCNDVLMLDDHRPILTLVQYYQMETRWNLRKILLHIFTNICQMSKRNISYLSASVLPLELTREILDPETTQEELQYTALVLGMILSMADTLPFTHFSIMNEKFVVSVMDGIEEYNRNPDTEPLAELYMTLLLAFNLQYHTVLSQKASQFSGSEAENLTIKVLSQQNDSKYFIEKILILFNREEDPVRMFEHDPQPPHSVLCMIRDIFSYPSTAQLLYTNDEKVLCDIILRQLTDLPPEDKRRGEYLSLLEGVVRLGRWKEHRHRRKELSSRLRSIQAHEDLSSDAKVASRVFELISQQVEEEEEAA